MPRPITLIHPPQAAPCEPPPGLPALAGHLRTRGLPVHLFDLNLATQEVLFTETGLREAADILAFRRLAPRQLTAARRSIRLAPRALRRLQRAATYEDATAYRAALNDLHTGYTTLSRAMGLTLGPAEFSHPSLSPLRAADLVGVGRNPESFPLSAAIAAALGPILATDPWLIGLSATYLSQALPSFALAGLLRDRGFTGTLLLGGGLLTSWGDLLTPASPAFEIWDGLVVGPGEEILATCEEGRPLPNLPGLLAPSVGVWRPKPSTARTSICFLPDGEDLPWQRYLAPAPILAMSCTRGCYWRRCAFCPESAQDRQPFHAARRLELHRAAETVVRARPRSWVHLTDDGIPPGILRHLCTDFAEGELSWYGFARLHPRLADPEFARKLAHSGCRMLQLGVETASQRLLDLMNKGVRADLAGPVVQNLTAAGIRTFVYLLFGIPTETEDDVAATLGWVEHHRTAVTFLNLALLNVPRGSELALHPRAFGLPAVDRDPEATTDLSLYLGHDAADPYGRRAARTRLERFGSEPVVHRILANTPRGFGSLHAAFAPLPDGRTAAASNLA